MKYLTPYALIFFGGGLGSCLRFGLGNWIQTKAGLGFPTGTMLVNISGALIIGVFLAAFVQHNFHPNWRLFFAIGVLGGYTTFSSFCYDAIGLVQSGNWRGAALYVLGTNVAGLAACYCGIQFAKLIS